MKKRATLLIATVTLLAMFIFYTVLPPRQQDNDILMEMVIWEGPGGPRGLPIYYYIIKNDGTFIVYYGLSRRDSYSTRTRNFIRSIQEREEMTLTDEELQHISEIVSKIVQGESEGETSTNIHVTFLHNGNIYENCTAWSDPLSDLIELILELTPLQMWHRFF